MKKTAAVLLAFGLIFVRLFGTVAYADNSSTDELEVSKAYVDVVNKPYLYIAVDYTALFDGNDARERAVASTTLRVKNNKTNRTVILSPTDEVDAPSGHIVFKYCELGMKNIGDELLICALFNGQTSGEVKAFSVLEYALRAEALQDEELSGFLSSLLRVGASTQKLTKHTGTYDLSKSWSLVVARGSTVKKRIVELGGEVTLIPDSSSGAGTVLYDSEGRSLESTTVIASSKYSYYTFIKPNN